MNTSSTNVSPLKPNSRPKVALFVTCLVDLFRPSVALSSIRLLKKAGCRVSVPAAQTCCGQPSYNNGDRAGAIATAKSVITEFSKADYVVVPSGSCAGMIKHHYPQILTGTWQQRAQDLADRTFEITTFLQDVIRIDASILKPATTGNETPSQTQHKALQTVTYHDSCAGLRELHIKQQPRALLEKQSGYSLVDMQDTEECCGFGGTFCTKMPQIAAAMTDQKLNNALATGADILSGGDLGCLLAIAGRAKRQGQALQVRHVIELLDEETNTPPIAETAS